MKYFSICSGIESASVAWHPLGFECVGVTEIDPFRSAVLNYHYPEVKNYGDFTKVEKEDIGGSPDIVVGGTPCATFSIAGLREGIESDRGNLALEFIRFIKRTNPKWVVWENVPGVLSSNGGRDFGSCIGGLAECGYGFAYRVLDTQYIRTQRFPRAIPQMRRRIFVVGHIGNWRRAAEVLFDEESLSGNHPPCRKEGEGAPTQTQEGSPGGNQQMRFRSGDFGRYVEDNVSSPIKARDYKSATDLISEKVDTNSDLTVIHGNSSRLNGDGFRKNGVSYKLTATEIPSIYNEIYKNDTENNIVFERSSPDGIARMRGEDVSPTLNAMTGGNRQPCVVNVAFKEDYPDDNNGLMHCGDEVDKVSVRKHRVDVKKLQATLQKHRKPIRKISEDLNVNKTTVEHWFRTDKSFSIPSPDEWLKVKEYLNIETDEFDKPIMEFEEKDNVFESSKRIYDAEGSYPTMTASNTLPKVFVKKSVVIRRLTPIEAERLQGLPDNYTQIPYRGKPKDECPISKRYEACGRAMSINVMEHLGTRIKMVQEKYGD